MGKLAKLVHSFVYSVIRSELKALNGGNKANILEMFLKEAAVA
jgi:hypothetical protein